ncbi:hypothetical protein B0H14DRAFT_2578571 [Mycena olivaceomarginata]|nr:hypothetical protein B0H14DRAFT_2578571 [Mycena olivaceomarginata]
MTMSFFAPGEQADWVGILRAGVAVADGLRGEFNMAASLQGPEGVREPKNLVFYRSLSQWEELEDVLPLNEDQLGILRLPGCFRPVTEDADTPDEQLSQVLLLAVPKIAQILATDNRGPSATPPVLLDALTYLSGGYRTTDDIINEVISMKQTESKTSNGSLTEDQLPPPSLTPPPPLIYHPDIPVKDLCEEWLIGVLGVASLLPLQEQRKVYIA